MRAGMMYAIGVFLLYVGLLTSWQMGAEGKLPILTFTMFLSMGCIVLYVETCSLIALARRNHSSCE
jgi:hypothetical protein